MKFLKEYIEYLKDNPEGYWFKNKLYGFGWTPANRAGWAMTIIFVFFVIFMTFYFQKYSKTTDDLFTFLALIVVSIFLFIAIIVRTGEPLRWQWGKKKNKKK